MNAQGVPGGWKGGAGCCQVGNTQKQPTLLCCCAVSPLPPPHAPLDEAPGQFPAVILVFQGSHCLKQWCQKGEGGRERGISIITQLPTCSSSTPHVACQVFLLLWLPRNQKGIKLSLHNPTTAQSFCTTEMTAKVEDSGNLSSAAQVTHCSQLSVYTNLQFIFSVLLCFLGN